MLAIGTVQMNSRWIDLPYTLSLSRLRHRGFMVFFNNGVHFVTVIYVCLFLERNLLYNVTEKCYVMKPCLVWKCSNKNYVFTPVTFPHQSPFHLSHLSTPVTFLYQSPFHTSHLPTLSMLPTLPTLPTLTTPVHRLSILISRMLCHWVLLELI